MPEIAVHKPLNQTDGHTVVSLGMKFIDLKVSIENDIVLQIPIVTFSPNNPPVFGTCAQNVLHPIKDLETLAKILDVPANSRYLLKPLIRS